MYDMATESQVEPDPGTADPTVMLWTRPAPGSRQPRFTREDIARAAIRVGDSEGFAALTMRRLAQELGAGTMTLYHYMRNKDELLSLVMDAIVAEIVVDDGDLPDDWRDALTLIAHRVRAAIERHPWSLDIHDDPTPGPHSLRHLDQSMRAVAPLGLPFRQSYDLVSAVDEYVYGYCLAERARRAGREQAGEGGDEARPRPDVVRYITDLLATGAYPALADLSADRGVEATMTRIARCQADPDRFDRNLQRLLTGFETGWEAAAPPGTAG